MVKAGKSVRNIIMESVEWIKMPLKYYIKGLSNELNLNFLFDEALDNFARRCSSREAVLISTALKLSNKIGGDLVFVLNNITETLQESLKTKSKVNTITLQSRYSGNIIALIPVLILVFLFFSMNSSIQEFFSNRIGNIFLIIGGILEIAGILVIRKILSVNN
jgi:tight adherence protein B